MTQNGPNVKYVSSSQTAMYRVKKERQSVSCSYLVKHYAFIVRSNQINVILSMSAKWIRYDSDIIVDYQALYRRKAYVLSGIQTSMTTSDATRLLNMAVHIMRKNMKFLWCGIS